MNAFYEHHQDNIAFGYRCFDRLLLNGLIQPFQQPERVIGFFNTYRQLYPVSRDVLRDIAGQFHNWVVNRSQKWGAPILDAPPDRRDKFMDPYFRRAKPNQVVAIIKGRDPARSPSETRRTTAGTCRSHSAGSCSTPSTSTIIAGDGCSSACVPTCRSPLVFA
jgi:hypothetical protein